MKAELRDRIINYNKNRAEADKKAADLVTLLNALPPGQVKQLLKDNVCAAILNKYGIGGD